jgi:SAM-dependent methyltransferase
MPPRHPSAFLTLTSQSGAISIGHLMLQRNSRPKGDWKMQFGRVDDFTQSGCAGRLAARIQKQRWSMAKINEIQYPQRMAEILNVSQEAVSRHLTEKPFLDPQRRRYFSDIGQLMGLLPAPDARILDLGAGVGWTSRFLYRCGYAVTALDISPTMIELPKATTEKELHFAEPAEDRLSFHVCDYESPFNFGKFDAAVIYDALHHAENEAAVIKNVHSALEPGGIFITMEPGKGHSKEAHSIEAMKRFGVTEKDMEYDRQRGFMLSAGFSEVRQFARLSELALFDLSKDAGKKQGDYLNGLLMNTVKRGSSSIVVAVK